MYSSVTADCDEGELSPYTYLAVIFYLFNCLRRSGCCPVYNYWEPLHFILYGDGFRTWEYSPIYAIRSWAYLLLHAAPARLFLHVNPTDKVRQSPLPGFFFSPVACRAMPEEANLGASCYHRLLPESCILRCTHLSGSRVHFM